MNFFGVLPFFSFLFLVGILIVKISILRKKGIQLSSKNGEKNKSKTFLFPVFLLVFLLWLFEIIKPAFKIKFSVLPEIFTKPLFESIFLNVLGAVILICSLGLWTFTLIHFNNSLRFGLDQNNSGKLVTTGIFSVSRNPFFLSLDLYFLGIALILPTPFFIVFALLAFTGIHFFILKEEKFMLNVYGEEYNTYSKITRRYF